MDVYVSIHNINIVKDNKLLDNKFVTNIKTWSEISIINIIIQFSLFEIYSENGNNINSIITLKSEISDLFSYNFLI